MKLWGYGRALWGMAGGAGHGAFPSSVSFPPTPRVCATHQGQPGRQEAPSAACLLLVQVPAGDDPTPREGGSRQAGSPFPGWASAYLVDKACGCARPLHDHKSTLGPSLGQCWGHSSIMRDHPTHLAALILLGAALSGEWTWDWGQLGGHQPAGL